MTEFIFSEPENCQACGCECLIENLKTIKLSSFDSLMTVCEKCYSKTPEASFKDAVDILKDIEKIANSSDNDPENRLRAIKFLLGE